MHIYVLRTAAAISLVLLLFQGNAVAGEHLHQLQCAPGEIAKFGGGVWACSVDATVSSLPWDNITSKPSGFADGVDNDTLGALSGCDVGEAPIYTSAGAWTCRPVLQPQELTRICGMNFTPGETIAPGTDIFLLFSDEIIAADVNDFSVKLLSLHSSNGAWTPSLFPGLAEPVQVSVDSQCALVNQQGADAVVATTTANAIRIPTSGLTLTPNVLETVEVHGDLIRDTQGRAIDAEHLPPWLPIRASGNGMEGGDFRVGVDVESTALSGPLQMVIDWTDVDGFDAPHVDDDLSVIIRGIPIYVDDNGLHSPIPPISFSGENGDTIRIVASDSGGICYVSGATLRRVCDGATQALTPFIDAASCTGGVFLDEIHTVNLPPPGSACATP